MKAKNYPDAQAPPAFVTQLSVILFLLALCFTAAMKVANASAPYTYRHGFISAVFATSARQFAQNGILPLSGVPVANNPPIGPNDSYVHWPPLLPITLSIWFRFFGISE